jgi:hypothetical protein
LCLNQALGSRHLAKELWGPLSNVLLVLNNTNSGTINAFNVATFTKSSNDEFPRSAPSSFSLRTGKNTGKCLFASNSSCC